MENRKTDFYLVHPQEIASLTFRGALHLLFGGSL
jgi:hypothetical protein